MNSKLKMLFFGVLIVIVFTGCSPCIKVEEKQKRASGKLMAAAWYQTSAEARALFYQAYNIARIKLDEALESRDPRKKYAVIVDIDETVLNNSPHQAKLIKTGEKFPAFWNEWTALGKAKPLPGAKEFLTYAVSKEVDVFYVSNRKEREKKGTLRNLKFYKFPQATDDHIFLKKDQSSKKSRRAAIAKTHTIVLLIGDNLNDFSEVFEKETISERAASVDKLKKEFGNKFIVTPNPMYGEWEGALYDYVWDLSEKKKESLSESSLSDFE